jgi:hypothetical protein
MNRCLRTFSLVGLSLVLMTGAGWAQATAGLAGRVTDEGGAVLPGVTVTATQVDTGFTRSVVTDGTGAWTMPNLPIGPYRLEVALPGFRTYVQTGIVLQVDATPTINAVLAVGNLEETIVVEAAAPIVDVRSAGISEVVEEDQIVELPLQGRQVTDLIVLAGGAIQTGRPNTKNFQGGVQISVAGGMDAGIGYFLDGVMHNDVSNAGGMPLPFPDALQEFRVATSGLSANNGVHAGASVNAVTKSGTNVLHGNVFEFLRDRRFNAAHPFAPTGPDGEKEDDGLRRNQFGGTLGGPIARDRLFFFGAYQGTFTRVSPTAEIAYVPTAAMLAGDFTAFTSPACNNGRQITLAAPFVNNRVSPALFSRAALNLAGRLPTTDDPCGETQYGSPDNLNDQQVVGRVDYQRSANNSIFGRYMFTSHKAPASLELSDNILASRVPGVDNLAQSLTLGNTVVMGARGVNAIRFAYNRTVVDRAQADFFEPSDLGIKVYNNSPSRETIFSVTDGFDVSEARATRGVAENNAFQFSEELTLVRGAHQFVLGANLGYWEVNTFTFWPGGGQFAFNGQITGAGLADFLLGRVSTFTHGARSGVNFTQVYQGYFVADEWRATDRVTVNAGLRWEPFFGQQIYNGSVANFDLDRFRQRVKSSVFVNAPAGLIYPGDADFPSGNAGFEKRWWNLGPRLGVAWDASGNGRTAVRASYGISYDFPEGETWFTAASGPPYGNRIGINDPPGGLDDPYGHVGGDPSPIVTNRDTVYPPFGTITAIDPEINAPRVQQWNLTVEQQLGTAWGVSASYLGSHSDRFWGIVEQNPGLYLGEGPCTLRNGVSYRQCTVPANLNFRRKLYMEHPEEAQYVSSLELLDDLSTQDYRGLKLSVRRRSAAGVNLSGNWTWGRCVGLQIGRGGGGGSGSAGGGAYANPEDPEYDRGYCDWDRTHLANLSAGYETPQLTGSVLNVLASNWRVTGIWTARSGRRFHVTTGTTAFNGLGLASRVNQISDDVYGEKTLESFLNRAAFENPAPGTFGNHPHNHLAGPNFWKVDLAVSRLVSLGTVRNMEVRLEAFNLFNTFNWGQPNANFRSGAFGRITTMDGDPRILQFGIKYGF